MLVIAGMRQRNADLVQARRPDQEAQVRVVGIVLRFRQQLPEQARRRAHDPRRLLVIDFVASHEKLHRGFAQVVMVISAEQVVEHAEAERTLREHHLLERELLENRRHDGQAARQHGHPVGAQPGQLQAPGVAGAQQHRA